MSSMVEYIECVDCGFVLLADSTTQAQPKRFDACPDCDGTDFDLPGE